MVRRHFPLMGWSGTLPEGGDIAGHEATRRLDEVWASENQATRAQFGSRVLNATPDQALRAAKAAMECVSVSAKPAHRARIQGGAMSRTSPAAA